MAKVTGIIPARLHSSRLPEKLLLAESGQPLIRYVWETASSCPELDELATGRHAGRSLLGLQTSVQRARA